MGSLVTARAFLVQQAKSQIIRLALSVCRYLCNGNQKHSLDSRNKCFYSKKMVIRGRREKESVKKSSSKSLFLRPTDSIQFSVVSHLCILFAFQYETVTEEEISCLLPLQSRRSCSQHCNLSNTIIITREQARFAPPAS